MKKISEFKLFIYSIFNKRKFNSYIDDIIFCKKENLKIYSDKKEKQNHNLTAIKVLDLYFDNYNKYIQYRKYINLGYNIINAYKLIN